MTGSRSNIGIGKIWQDSGSRHKSPAFKPKCWACVS